MRATRPVVGGLPQAAAPHNTHPEPNDERRDEGSGPEAPRQPCACRTVYGQQRNMTRKINICLTCETNIPPNRGVWPRACRGLRGDVVA
jgi:hypothetical protein